MFLENSRQFIGKKLLAWYEVFGRDLPFRKTTNPYHIWICEIIFQQTRIAQGLAHYENFIEKFPNVQVLANADEDAVLLAWKGLGYYSRALNLQKAAQQIVQDFGGDFPNNYEAILSLKGVGKYTAAAISSICFGEKRPAVDGNFYRVLSRLFADDFDISGSRAFSYFENLALQIMPEKDFGKFNEAMMDLGSEICTPKNPKCTECPLNADCAAFASGTVANFPVKLKKTKTEDLSLRYFFIFSGNQFLVRQRGEDFIWKKLYDFPDAVPEDFKNLIKKRTEIRHKLTHRNLFIEIFDLEVNFKTLEKLAAETGGTVMSYEESLEKSFPTPLQKFLEKRYLAERQTNSEI